MTRSPGLERLFVTTGAVGVALAAHLGHLPAWIGPAFAGAALWRLLGEHRGWAPPAAAARGALALGGTVAVLATFHTLNGLEAGTALLAVMAALKLLETRTPRDHAVLVFVGYLLCLASLLVGQSPGRFAVVLATVWLLTAALARVHRPTEANSDVRPFRLAARTLLLGAPLAAILFAFVPRIEGRFWALPAPSGERQSGIDDEMSPGDVARLGLSDEPAFRVWFNDRPPPGNQRYFRMIVLEDFDGRRWRRATSHADAVPPDLDSKGPAYGYRIALEPTGRDWLPGLDVVVRWPGDLSRLDRGGILTHVEPGPRDHHPVTSRLSYTLESEPFATMMPASLPEDLRRRDLRLPEGRALRARALARELRDGAGTDSAYIDRVLGHFRRDGFSYTLEPPLLGEDPVDEFLFGTRAGFCEHYASAFAVLMRAAGLPARVVVGYQGGEWNGYGGYLLVRQSRAHAWTEVWLDGRGWQRVDPTAAVAPDRVNRVADELAGLASDAWAADLPWLGRARALWDASRTLWYDAVVNFDPARQTRLLDALGLGRAGIAGLAVALAGGFALTAVALAGWLAWELRPRARDPVQTAWVSLCARLAGAGLARAPSEGPLDYARRVATRAPALGAELERLANAYVSVRYLPGASDADARAFVAAAGRLRPGAARPSP